MTDVKESIMDDQVQVPIPDEDGDVELPVSSHEDDRVSSDDDQDMNQTDDGKVSVSIEEEVHVPMEKMKVQDPIHNDDAVPVPSHNNEFSVSPHNNQVPAPTSNPIHTQTNPLTVPTYHNKTHKPPPSTTHAPPRRLPLHTLNLLGYILNLSASYLGGVAGWFGGKPTAELSAQYQTLLTPAAPFFVYIWGIIFLFEGFFAAAQLLPRYRDRVLVRKGIHVWFFGVCVAQSAWTAAFGYECMITAFVCMVAIGIGLGRIVNGQWAVVAEGERRTEEDPWLLENNAVSVLEEDRREEGAAPPSLAYWLLRFPFAVHAGWIAPATPLMLSVVLVSVRADTQVELWTAVLGVAVLFGLCMGLLLRQDKGAPSYVIPGVVAYACVGIMMELDAPNDSILGRFQEGEISLVKNLAGFCGAMLLVTIVSRFFAILLRDHCCRRKYEEEDDNVIYVEADDV